LDLVSGAKRKVSRKKRRLPERGTSLGTSFAAKNKLPGSLKKGWCVDLKKKKKRRGGPRKKKIYVPTATNEKTVQVEREEAPTIWVQSFSQRPGSFQQGKSGSLFHSIESSLSRSLEKPFHAATNPRRQNEGKTPTGKKKE